METNLKSLQKQHGHKHKSYISMGTNSETKHMEIKT